MNWSLRILLAMAVITTVMAGDLCADILTLDDGNAQVVVDTDTQDGVSAWSVDGENQLAKQWYWMRIGGIGPEISLDTFNLNTAQTFNTDFDPGDDRMQVLYVEPTFEVLLDFNLAGGLNGSGVSSLSQTFRIRNLSGSPLDVHFFSYMDFNLEAQPGLQMVEITGTPENTATQTFILNQSEVEIIGTPPPDRFTVGLNGPGTPLLDALNDGLPTDLDNQTGPSGVGDALTAFQWSQEIDVGESFLFGLDLSLVDQGPIPEPASLLIMGLGGLALISGRKPRQNRRSG